MDTLRLSLLIIGIVFIAGLYVFARLKSGEPFKWPRLFPRAGFSFNHFMPRRKAVEASHDAPADFNKHDAVDEPDASDIQQLSEMTLPGDSDPIDADSLGPISALPLDDSYAGEPLVIVMTIMAKAERRLSGLNILDAVLSNGLEHGEMNIFHRYLNNDQKHIVCSLANTVEPGSFDLTAIEDIQTPGLSLFLQLPGPLEGREAFDQMLNLGRTLADQLDAELCDETRGVLTVQTIGHLKEKIEAFRFKQKMANIQKHRQ